jgi:hypothetical protein
VEAEREEKPENENWIAFHCLCGKTYFSFCGLRSVTHPMGTFDPKSPRWNPIVANKYRYHKCPHCGHVWDLSPHLPKLVDEKVQKRKAILNAAILGGGKNANGL